MTSKTFTVKEAATELGVSVQTAYAWIKTGRLKASNNGGQAYIALADLRACKATLKPKVSTKPITKPSSLKKQTVKSTRVELLEIADALYELANKMPLGR